MLIESNKLYLEMNFVTDISIPRKAEHLIETENHSSWVIKMDAALLDIIRRIMRLRWSNCRNRTTDNVSHRLSVLYQSTLLSVWTRCQSLRRTILGGESDTVLKRLFIPNCELLWKNEYQTTILRIKYIHWESIYFYPA